MSSRNGRRKPVEKPQVIDLKHLHVLRVQPGDVLVLQLRDRPSAQGLERIRDQFARVFGNDVRLLLLVGGATFGVIRGPEVALAPSSKEGP